LVFSDVRLDLESGAVRLNAPDSFVTKALPWKYEPASATTRAAWRGFLEGTELDVNVVGYLQRALGAAATGLCTEKLFLYLYGETGTAKTTFVELVSRALDCYTAKVDSRVFMVKRGAGAGSNGHTDDLMSLPGARLCWCDETLETDRFDTKLVKALTAGTGRSTLRLSAKGEKGTDVRVSFLAVFTSEHLVRVDAEDGGMFARQKIVRFSHVVPVDERDPRYAEKSFPAMQPAIVEWLVAGAQAWLKGGMGEEPAAITAAGKVAEEAQDWLGDLLDEIYQPKEGAGPVSFVSIRQAVAEHLASTGRRNITVTDTKLGTALTRMCFLRHSRTRARMGLEMLSGHATEYLSLVKP
jgi:putative DNA primase/helicase